MKWITKTKFSSGWFLLALISFSSGMAAAYWEGPVGSPVSIFAFLALLLSVVALAWCWLWTALKRQGARAVGGMLLVAAGLVVASVPMRPDGFPRYVKTVLTTEEWRTLARFAQARLGPEGRLPGPEKNLWNEHEHRTLWSEFCSATPIQKLDPSLMIFVHREETEIVWGGALAEHKAVIISADGKRLAPPHGRHTTSTFIADDIVTLSGPD